VIGSRSSLLHLPSPQLQLCLLLQQLGAKPERAALAVFLTNALSTYDAGDVKPELRCAMSSASQKVRQAAKVIGHRQNPPYDRFIGAAQVEEAESSPTTRASSSSSR